LQFCSLFVLLIVSPQEARIMDNRLNEIRRKIRALRADMLDLSDTIGGHISRGEDCSSGSLRLMAMRREMLALIDRRNAMGGREECFGARRFKPDARSLRERAPLQV
jgi:hypothetical protein